jgi:guanylate kinase
MIVLIGPSATGKTVCEREMEKRGFKRIISYTTRPIRQNEEEDVDYHYITLGEFNEKEKENFWAEKTIYRGWKYGIAKDDCIDNAIAVVETFGFLNLKKINNLKITSFFIKTSDRTRLIRMAQRGDDINEIIRRLFSDQGSFACIDQEVDYIIENENRSINETVNEIIGIINKTS